MFVIQISIFKIAKIKYHPKKEKEKKKKRESALWEIDC